MDNEEAKLVQQKTDLLKQIERTIPEQIRKTERETEAIKAKKPRLNKQLKLVKERINEVNVQDVQLLGQGINTLSKQVNPSFKGVIEEKDITNYSEILDKIHKHLIESQQFLPAQEYSNPIQSPEPQTQTTPAKVIGGSASSIT